MLYRKATEQDAPADQTTVSGLEGNFVAVQTLTTADGVVTTDALPLLADGEPYYLVETKAPIGLILLDAPLKVSIDMTGHNTWTPLLGTPSQQKPNPYVLSNWLQEATILVTNLEGEASESAVRVYNGDETTVTYDHENDTTAASVIYKIINQAGAVLPATGGLGAGVYRLLGALMIALSGAALALRRKRRIQ